MLALDKFLPFRCNNEYGGPGYLAGEPPPDPNPHELDGRTYVLGQIKPLRIIVMDSLTRRVLAQTFSAADGTWRVDGLRPGHDFAVEFVNPGGFYTVEISGQMLPVNSFVQDFVRAQPYADDPPEP